MPQGDKVCQRQLPKLPLLGERIHVGFCVNPFTAHGYSVVSICVMPLALFSRRAAAGHAYFSPFLLVLPPHAWIGAQFIPRRARPRRLQTHHPFAVHHHTDDQHIYRCLRQIPVSRLSKSVIPFLLGELLLPMRLLIGGVEIQDDQPRLPASAHRRSSHHQRRNRREFVCDARVRS